MDEPTLEQSIEVLLSRVPKAVRDYVLSDLSNEVNSLMTKYNLHVDQGGVLQRELLLMLLGQQTPTDFLKVLQDSGIPESTVQSLLLDINEDVFKPLREKERTAPAQEAPPQEEPAPTPAPAPAPMPPPVPEPQLPKGHTMQSDAQAAPPPPTWQPPAPPPINYAPYPQQYVPMPPQTYWVPVSVAQVPYQPPAQPPQPTPEPVAPPPPPRSEAPSAPVAPAPEPQPQTWAPPPNLPTGAPTSIPPPPPPPITREYGADPYREPI